jgi:uncharacterized protein (DUF58 family)
MLKTWIIYAVTSVATFIFFLYYKMWVSWYCLMLLPLIPILAIICCMIATVTLTYETELPADTHIGNPVNLVIKVYGLATYYSFSRIELTITDLMSGEARKITVPVNDNGVTKIPMDTGHCGAYSVQVTKFAVYDLLGFFHLRLKAESKNKIIVKPMPVMPDIMPNMSGFKAKNLRKSKLPNSEIYDIRDYQKGDSIKTIHWKISAKKDELLVKESLEEFGGHSRIVLKLSGDRTKLDLHLGQILFTSLFFLEREIPHKIRIIPPDRSEISYDIENAADLESSIVKILHMRIPKEAADEKQ